MVLEISDVVDTLTEYATMFPSVQDALTGVKGSQLSWATAGAMMEDEDSSLGANKSQRKCKTILFTVLTADMAVSNFVAKTGILQYHNPVHGKAMRAASSSQAFLQQSG